MALCSRFELAGWLVAGRTHFVGSQRLEQVVASIKRPDMRAEELVGGANEKVTAQVLHIDGAMRRIVHSIHIDPGFHIVRQLGHTSHMVDRTHRVRCVSQGNDPGPRGDGRLQICHIEGAVSGVEIDKADDGAAFLQRQPGRDVGIVIETGDDNLVARRECPTDSPAHGEGQAGHVGAKNDLFRPIGIHQVGDGPAGLHEGLVGPPAVEEGTVEVAVRLNEVPRHGLDD